MVLIGTVNAAAGYAFHRRRACLPSFGSSPHVSLVVFWFDFLDGFWAKADNFDKVTFVAGSEAEVVATAMHLWSQEATTFFLKEPAY